MGYDDREIENGIIESTMLGYEDHGVLTAYLHIKMDGSGQGFGGYGLDGNYDKEKKERDPSLAAGMFIKAVLKTVGVEKWEDLKGKHVRVDHTWSKVHRIGHIIEDIWCEPAVLFAPLREAETEVKST